METIDYQGYKIKIEQDEDASNPRTEWDNLGTMACSHSRYTLGDTDGVSNLREAVRNSVNYKESWEVELYLDSTLGDLVGVAEQCSDILMLPLYLYDHSGITMSTGSFSCPWDSGQVGVIFITKDTIKEENCRPQPLKKGQINPDLKPIKHVTKKDIERALGYLKGEVETYDNYLTGSVYGYTIEDRNEEEIEDGSCWGFYGYDNRKSGLLEYAENAVDCEITGRMKEHMQAAIAQAHTDHASYAHGANI